MTYPNKIKAEHTDTHIQSDSLTGNYRKEKIYRFAFGNHSARDAAHIFLGRAVDAGLTGCLDSLDYGQGWEIVARVGKNYSTR